MVDKVEANLDTEDGVKKERKLKGGYCSETVVLYLKTSLIGLSLLCMLLASNHYKLFIYQYRDRLTRCGLICELVGLAGAIVASLSSCIFCRYIPAAALVGLCLCLYFVSIIVSYLLSNYWADIAMALLESWTRNTLLTASSYVVAHACSRQSQGNSGVKYKHLLQMCFAIFFGFFQSSYIFSSLFSAYSKLNETHTFATSYELINVTSIDRCKEDNVSSCLIVFDENPMKAKVAMYNDLQSTQHVMTIAVYVISGLSATGLCVLACYLVTRCEILQGGQPLILHVRLIAQWKCGFLLPCMAYNGFIEGYIFSDFILVNYYCFGFGEYKQSAIICYGAFNCLACVLLSLMASRVNRVYRMTIISLFQISVIIILIVLPVRVQNAALFYISMALLGACSMLWRTQISVLIALILPDHKLQGYTNYYLFHSIGYALAACTTGYLCMNTKLYFLLGAAILAQFLYLVDELKLKILKISMQRGPQRDQTKMAPRGLPVLPAIVKPLTSPGSNGGAESPCMTDSPLLVEESASQHIETVS